MSELRLKLGQELLPHQRRFATWRPDEATIADGFDECALLGGFGSAKTTGLLAKAIVLACENGWRPEYGELTPRVAITGPTERNVLRNLMPKFKRLLPRQLVREERGRPYPSIKLLNGCVVEFASYEAVLEGDDMVGVFVDEISLLRDSATLQNLRNRCRDPLARRRSFAVAGLPEAGWVRQHFDPAGWEPGEQRRRLTMLVGTRDNKHLPRAHLENILSACPAGYESALVGGGWLPTKGALYDQFDRHVHVVPNDRATSAPIKAVGLDLGVSSAAVLVQEERLPGGLTGALIVGDVVRHGGGTEDLARAVRDHRLGHLIRPGTTVFCVDPSTLGNAADARAAIQRVFPDCRVHQRKRTDPLFHVEPGVRLVQAALRNAKGEVRLHVIRSLEQTNHGVVDAFLNERINERTGNRLKVEAKQEHCADAMRYAVTFVLEGKRGFDPKVIG